MRETMSSRNHRRLAIFASAVALGVLAAACGGGGGTLSKADYEREVRSIGNDLSGALETIFSDPALQSDQPTKEQADIVRQGADLIRKAGDDLAGVEPPADIERHHEQLVDGIHEFADDLDGWARFIEDGDEDAIIAFSEQLQAETVPSMVTITEATDAIKAAGYDISDE